MCPDGQEQTPPTVGRYCPNCGTKLDPGTNFCPNCGTRLTAPNAPVFPTYPVYPTNSKSMTLRDMGMGVGAYAVLALLFLMAANVVIMLWGMGQVYPHMDSSHAYLYIITPFLVDFAQLGGVWFFLYYVLLAVAITASFIWMVWKSFPTFSKELKVKYPEKEGHSPLYLMGTLFMAVMAFNIVFYLLVESSGISPTTPSGVTTSDLWVLLYSFAEASVWEEIVSRILLIGVPLLIIDFLLMSSNPERKMKKASQYILGGGFTIGKKEAFFMVFSALMFGTAHVFSWDVWKILPAAVAGLAFAYLFLKVGVYASIMLHFAFDYLSIPLDVAPDNLALASVLGLLIIAWIVVGIPYLAKYVARGLGWFIGKSIWPDVPRAKPQQTVAYQPMYQPQYYQQPYYAPPPAYGQGPAQSTPQYQPRPPQPRPSNPTAFGFTCRNCGNTEAVYKDGQLICTKCGSKN